MTDISILAVWLSSLHVGLVIQRFWIQVPLWPPARFVLSHLKFKTLAMLVNIQLVVSCQLGFLMNYLFQSI